MPWKVLRSNTTGGGLSRSHSFFEKPDPSPPDHSNDDQLKESRVRQDGKTENLPPHSFMALPTPPSARSTSDLTSREDFQQPEPQAVLPAPRGHRFSLLKLRHASDPQLSKSYSTSAPDIPPPLPDSRTPTIITTAPTAPPLGRNGRLKDRWKLPGRSLSPPKENPPPHRQGSKVAPGRASGSNSQPNLSGSKEATTNQHVTFEAPSRFSTLFARGSPPAYGDLTNTSLALPPPRLSESSRSDASSGEHRIYAETTTTHTVSTTTTFFRLPRRRKDKGHLFPLPIKIPPTESKADEMKASTPSPSGLISSSPMRQSPQNRQPVTAIYAPELRPTSSSRHPSPSPSPNHSAVSLATAPPGSSRRSVYRTESITSYRSANSTPSASLPPSSLGSRDPSSTMISAKRTKDGESQSSPQLLPPGRTSTSTAGRKSLSDMLSLSQRFRHNSEPLNGGNGKISSRGPGTPRSANSKPNSFQIQREQVTYPERAESDNPATYLAKLEEAVNRGVIAAILCKTSDDFSKTCLRKYMRGFSYFADSIDIAVRKMLMEVELPKETQQIDRLLQGFADRYCECNPGIFVSTDEAYFVAFSILLLHSDTHNKNNKRKMQRADYVKNTQGQVEVSHDILGCFYDNVSYTPFIHFEDEVATNSHRLAVPKPKKGLFKTSSADSLRGPVDPYALILDQKLELLRPPLKEVMNTEDPYSCTGTVSSLDASTLYEAFYRASVLQIVSARSRPDAFLYQATISNPSQAQVGLVDIKAAKVGLLWRKDPKKKKTRSPWQEWGALLTSSQLYFFRDVAWVKSLMSQYDAHQKSKPGAGAVVFKPPLASFQPDALLSMDDAVALLDAGYRKHKNAFLFIKHGGFEEVFLANNEDDMNDWIARLNYAATFRTAGVRMRGLIGANYEGQHSEVDWHHSGPATQSFRSDAGEAQTHGRHINQQLAGEILASRRQIMRDKIAEADDRLAATQKELDNLLRNARHLQICSPIQGKTRESLVLAAGRMSAKLKWTRVEMWRTRGHRDVMKMDLEQECAGHPAAQAIGESSPSNLAPEEKSRPKLSSQVSKKSDLRATDLPASPKSTRSVFSSTSLAHSVADTTKAADTMPPLSSPGNDENHERHLSIVSFEQAMGTDEVATDSRDKGASGSVTGITTRSLNHQLSITSSLFVRSDGDSVSHSSSLATPTPSIDGEERLLREAGLLDGDQQTPSTSRQPETSESEPDFNAVTSQDIPSKDRVSGRHSLQRTLRDAPNSPQTPQSLRHRRGKDAAGHVSPAASMRRSSQSGSEGLARKAGSFRVHGKKASVVTFGAEWQSMSTEERIKLRKQEQSTKEAPVQRDARERGFTRESSWVDVRDDDSYELVSSEGARDSIPDDTGVMISGSKSVTERRDSEATGMDHSDGIMC